MAREDITMQAVPSGGGIKEDAIIEPEQDMITNDPDGEFEEASKEFGLHKNEEADEDEDDYDPSTALAREKHWLLLVVEAIAGLIFFLLPAGMIAASGGFNEYDLFTEKGPNGLNEFREFQRWCIFLGVSHLALVLAELVFRWLPWLAFKFFGWVGKELTRGERTAVWCLRYAAHYLGMATALVLIFNWAELVLYESTTLLAARQVFSRLDWQQRIKAYELMQGERIESALAAAFMLVICVAAEKYLVAAIHASFHRVALEPRIEALNKRFVVLAHLYHACIARGGAASDEETKTDLQLATAADKKIRAVAKTVFSTLCPLDRNYITWHDLQPYFAPAECGRAFDLFDTNRVGQLDRHDLKRTISSMYDERVRVLKTIVANRRIIKKLDYVLMVIALIFGVLFALVVVNQKGYGWVTSLGTFILGFSFLFQTTVSRVFDTFLFVFIEHAYDVSDNVVVDNERLCAHEIEIFTTIFVRNDGVIVYSPNSSLKGKTIYNRQRMRSELDEIVFTLPTDTGIDKIIKIRSKLTDYLTETINEFTGVVAMTKVHFRDDGEGGRRASFKVEPKYRPREADLRSEQSLKERRAGLLQRFQEICQELALHITLEDPHEA